jgi:hypothetical protein
MKIILINNEPNNLSTIFAKKEIMRALIVILFLSLITPVSWSQKDITTGNEKQLVKIIQTDKTELIGYILKEDEREIQFETQDGRKIFIPQYVIKQIVPINSGDFNVKGDYVGEDLFATRYFITTNGLPMKKGEHYIQWNLFGPDFQFAINERFGVGLMTSWLAVPIIGTAKYSFEINERNQFAVGAMLGTSSWAAFSGVNFGGALPFATISHGDRKANIALSAGYGAVWNEGNVSGRALTSIAGMIKVGPKISLVFDSFIVLRGRPEEYTYIDYVYNNQTMMYDEIKVTETRIPPGLALLIPGIRWHQEEGKAFQFGFTGIAAEGELFPVPIPMVQWYRRI